MKTSLIAAGVAGTLALAITGFASATQTYNNNLKVYDGVDHDMISGNGNPIDNFTQNSYTDTSGNTIYVSLKARNRDTGEPTSQSGDDYYVDAGTSSVNQPGNPQLEYDFQFDPGADGTTDFYLQLNVDFARSTATSFATLEGNESTFWPSLFGDRYTNGTEGSATNNTNAWNNSSVPYVISDSGNLGFWFWPFFNSNAANYDPTLSGDYEIQFNVFDPTGKNLLAGTTIHAIVGNPAAVPVPEPGELGVMGLGLLLIGGMVWRDRNRKELRIEKDRV